jgi:hypothetical protein
MVKDEYAPLTEQTNSDESISSNDEVRYSNRTRPISVRNGPGRVAGFRAGFDRPGRAGDFEARAKGGRPGLWFESLRPFQKPPGQPAYLKPENQGRNTPLDAVTSHYCH